MLLGPGREVIPIESLETKKYEGPRILQVQPEMVKTFWPEVRGSYFFHNRRAYLEFMQHSGGRIFYIPVSSRSKLPFILVGNWRSRADITAMWHIKAVGTVKKGLVLGSASICFEMGAERFITKPLGENEAEEFASWGFQTAYRIVLLEMRLNERVALESDRKEFEITRFKRRQLEQVLEVDATAFDDFWRLDATTLETVATSCYRNVFLLARREGEILGYAIGGANGRLGYVQRLGVHAVHQGEGIGEALVCCLLRAVRHIGATMIMVNTQDENEVALNLYQKLGFEETPGSRFIMQYTASEPERG